MKILKTLLRIPNSIYSKITAIAEKEMRSINSTIVIACKEYAERNKE